MKNILTFKRTAFHMHKVEGRYLHGTLDYILHRLSGGLQDGVIKIFRVNKKGRAKVVLRGKEGALRKIDVYSREECNIPYKSHICLDAVIEYDLPNVFYVEIKPLKN